MGLFILFTGSSVLAKGLGYSGTTVLADSTCNCPSADSVQSAIMEQYKKLVIGKKQVDGEPKFAVDSVWIFKKHRLRLTENNCQSKEDRGEAEQFLNEDCKDRSCLYEYDLVVMAYYRKYRAPKNKLKYRRKRVDFLRMKGFSLNCLSTE